MLLETGKEEGIMLRSVQAAVAGYVTIAAAVFASLSVAYSILGPEFAFHEASSRSTLQWTLVALLSGLLSALAGGWVAGRAGESSQAFLILVGIVLVLGIVSAVYSMTSRPQIVADADISDWGFMEASLGASEPVWYVFLIPLVGALGVLWGGRLGYPESGV